MKVGSLTATGAVDFAGGGEPAFTVWPNPAADFVLLRTQAPAGGLLQVFGVSGQLLESHRLQQEETRIDTRYWPAGRYLLRLGGQARWMLKR